jgi:predicted nucleic acid-binding protein
MKCVVDTNVFIAALRPDEKSHLPCRDFLQRCLQTTTSMICPVIVLAEISGCIARAVRNPHEAEVVLLKFRKNPSLRLIPIDATIAESAARFAARLFLKGADAIYLATAKSSDAPLITLDDEILSRGQKVATVQTPDIWLANHPV